MEKLFLPALHLTALVAFLLYKAKTPFFNFIKSRHAEVSDGLNKAQVQAEWAETRRKNIDEKISHLHAEKEKIISEWKTREQTELKVIAESSQKLISQMKTESEQNKKALEQQVKSQILKKFAEQIVTNVEAKVKAGLTQDSHKSINEQFIKEVSI